MANLWCFVRLSLAVHGMTALWCKVHVFVFKFKASTQSHVIQCGQALLETPWIHHTFGFEFIF